MIKLRTLLKTGFLCLFGILAVHLCGAQIVSYTSATTGALNAVATHATGTALARVNGDVAPGSPCGTGFSSSSFTTATTYSSTLPAIEVTVTPATGYMLNVTGFSADMRRSATGPASVRYAYSTNGGTTWIDQGSNQAPNNASCGTTTTGSWATTFSVTAPSTLKFRVYGFNASSTAGTFQILNLNINGTVASSTGCTPPTLSTAVTNVSCNAGNNGAIALTTTGGSSPFTYSWSNGATTQNISSLTAGTYSVTVTATGGCTATTSATVTQPVALSSSISSSNTSPCGGTAGQATVSAAGGTTAYTYSWNSSPVQTTATATGLAPRSYTATVTDAHGCTSSSVATIGVNTLSGLSATSITTSSATLNWTDAGTSASYNIQYRQTGTGTWTSTTSTTTSKAITALTSATSYEFQVQAVCTGGATSSFSASGTFTTTGTSCGIPGGLSASGVTTSTATLNWGAVTGATSYNVQYRQTGTTPWTSTSSTGTSVAVSSLTAATTYEFQVQAVCSGGNSAFSVSTNFTTSGGGTGTILTYTTATDGSLSSVATGATGTTLTRQNGATAPGSSCGTGFNSTSFTTATTFSSSLPATEVTVTPSAGNVLNVTGFSADMRRSSTGPASVRYAYSTDGGSTWIDQGTNQSPNNASCGTTTTSTWTTSFTALSSLKFRVYGFNASSSAGTFQVQNININGSVASSGAGTVCATPFGLAAASITSSSATLSWTDTGFSSSYNIQYRQTGTSTWSSTTSTFTNVPISGLSASTTYEFQVQSVCSVGGTTSFSPSSTFTTSAASSCAIPGGLNATGVSTSSATLNWSAASGAVSYNVQYRQVGAGSWISTTSTTTSKAITGLASTTSYEFQVQTVCSGGSSAFSASTDFTTTGATGCDASLWSHVYNPSRLTVNQACITITGTVANKINEADGDIHIRVTVDPAYSYMINSSNVSGQHGDLVVEPVCTHAITQSDAVSACVGFSNSVYIPNIGEHVIITGAFTTDQNHGWNEIHPVTSITVGAPHPGGGGNTTTGINEATGNSNLTADDITVYPNPARSFINFKLAQKPSAIVRIVIVDELGRLAGQYQMLETTELKAETNYFPAGKYYYSILEDNKLIKGGTFIKR